MICLNNITRAGRSTLLITLLALSVFGFAGIAHSAVYVSMMDGSQKNKITRFQNWYEHFVSWQPNGEYIAELAGPLTGSSSRLFLVPSKGEGLRTIARGVSPDTAPQWSPDGEKIAYLRESNYNGVLYVVNLTSGHKLRMSRQHESVESFSWDPDSTSMVYVEGPFNSARRVWLDGKRKKVLGSRANPLNLSIAYDGTMAVHGLYAVSLYDWQGHYLRSILRANESLGDFKWSPNGRWLAYMKDTRKYGDTLYAVNIDGKRRLRLGPRDYDVVSFDWSFDSSKIFFRDLDDVWIVDINTKERRRLPGIGSDGQIAISPGGDRIAYTD